MTTTRPAYRGSNIDQTVDYVDNTSANTGSWQPPTNILPSGSVSSVGKQNRMAQNAIQNVGADARPQRPNLVQAQIGENARETESKDWRVSLSVPSQLQSSNIFSPFAELQKMIFPFNPTILLGASANYSGIQPVHTNQPFYAYENSQIDQITITGEFVQENDRDAKYWIAVLHYLRTMTKMFYGESDPVGNPPMVVRLNGYGKHVLNNIPVVITNFTTDLPQDVDYIECTVNEEVNFVPVQSTFTVTVQPQYARRSHSRFSLNEYINGTHIGGPEGFV